MLALAAVLVSFSFLEEGEGLRNSRSSHSAGAALNFRHAVGVFADKFALGLGAGRLVALPVTLGFLADGFTLGLGSLAVGDAMGLLADGDALGAVEHFAAFIRAFNFALRLLALDVANGVLGFGAGSMAFRRFADGVANSGAVGVVALP